MRRISFCPNTPPISPYTFLGLSTCTLGTSLWEIYCEKRHLLLVRMLKPMFRMSEQGLSSSHNSKRPSFSAWDTTIKIDCTSQHSEFWGARKYRGCIGKKWGCVRSLVPYARSWIVTSSFTRKIAHKCDLRIFQMSFHSRLYVDRDSWILHLCTSLRSFAWEGSFPKFWIV